jgi:hypothetical protein
MRKEYLTMIYRATARQIKLNNSVMPVAFGHYAWLREWENEKAEVKEAGSGIFAAPGIGLGARHVSRGFAKLDDRIEAAQRRMTILADQYAPRPVVTQYAGLLYQAPTVRMPTEADISYWGAFVDWASPDTDITVLQAEPISAASQKAADKGMAFIEWQFLSPDRGSQVDVFGFPNAKITVDSGVHVQNIEFRSETVRVVENFAVLQSHGFTQFPGFQVDRELDHGFSGGPVFYHDRLVGLFSGPNYVSTLWPLLIHKYPHREDNPDIDLLNAGSIAKTPIMRRFVDLFTNGSIRAVDFEAVNGRVRRVPCEEALAASKIESRCEKSHVVLAQ